MCFVLIGKSTEQAQSINWRRQISAQKVVCDYVVDCVDEGSGRGAEGSD